MRLIGEPVEPLTPARVHPSGTHPADGDRADGDRADGDRADGDRADEGGTDASAPLAFRWRGRRYVVGTVLAHWVETGAWWRCAPETPSETPSTTGPDDPERRLWRVEACRGSHTGVFDLCCETSRPGERPQRRWVLQAIHD